MAEPPANSDKSTPAAATGRAIKWDAVAAIIASLVGLLALIIAGYTAYIQRYTAQLQREQVQAQVWPRIEMSVGTDGHHWWIEASNQGVGPAIVQSLQVLANGKPVANVRALRRLFDMEQPGELRSEFFNGAVLTPGEGVSWLVTNQGADAAAFMDAWRRTHLRVRVCYSSTLGDSWLLTYGTSRLEVSPRPVSSCPKLPEKDQFVD